MQDLQVQKKRQKEQPRAPPPHHIKDVIGSVQLERLEKLTTTGPTAATAKDAYMKALHLVGDALLSSIAERERGASLPRVRASRTTAIQRLLEVLKIAVSDDQQSEANSTVFDMEERAKHRLRILMDTQHINRMLRKTDLGGITLPTNALLREMAKDAFFVTLDAQAFFDQLELPRAVRRWFRFKAKGIFYESAVVPMGYKGACDLAQAVASLLLAYDSKGVRKCAYIDNFYFSGNSEEEMVAALTEFLDRAQQVGLAINVPEACNTPEVIAKTAEVRAARGTAAYSSLVISLRQLEYAAIRERLRDLMRVSELDVLGEHFDRVAGTRCCTSTTIEKLQAAKNAVAFQRDGLITNRCMAAVFGIVLYGARVLNQSPAPYFNAMREFRLLGARAQQTAWDATANRLSEKASAELDDWLGHLLCNTPVPLVLPVAERHCTVFTDASCQGYGAVAVFADGNVRTISRRWSREEHEAYDLYSSVTAEPRAVELVMTQLFAQAPSTSAAPIGIHVTSDHAGLVYAGNAGYGRGVAYNQMCARLQRAEFQHCKFTFAFVAGVANPADRYSRFFESAEQLPTVRLGWPTVRIGLPHDLPPLRIMSSNRG